MGLFNFVCALITRAMFILLSLVGVCMVIFVQADFEYIFLTFLLLPLVVEMIVTLCRRSGKDYKWFSPPIFLFLVSIIPSIWILELCRRTTKTCKKLDPLENMPGVFLDKTWGNVTDQNNLTCKKVTNLHEVIPLNENTDLEYLLCKRVTNLLAQMPLNKTADLEYLLSAVCSKYTILALHQILLILLIVGKWLLPIGGGLTRNELSQLLLIFVGTAADTLEFISETLKDVKDNPELVYIILAVWTWSMLQFPLHLGVVNTKPGSQEELAAQESSLLKKYSSDLWSITEALFIQDGPFLVVRLTVMTYFHVSHQMLVFFTTKNILVVLWNLYRLDVIFQDFRPSRSSS